MRTKKLFIDQNILKVRRLAVRYGCLWPLKSCEFREGSVDFVMAQNRDGYTTVKSKPSPVKHCFRKQKKQNKYFLV